jgi:hypothetical protein
MKNFRAAPLGLRRLPPAPPAPSGSSADGPDAPPLERLAATSAFAATIAFTAPPFREGNPFALFSAADLFVLLRDFEASATSL